MDIFDRIDALREQRNAVILPITTKNPMFKTWRISLVTLFNLPSARDTDADVILFCGVHFMAETAKILNQTEWFTVPDMKAGCSLADSAPAKRIANWKEAHPDHVLVSYVNCTAGVEKPSAILSARRPMPFESLKASPWTKAFSFAQIRI